MKLNKFPKDRNSDGALREQLLRHALSEFSKKGFNGTNIDEIARSLKISKKTIYTLFPSKRDLFLACSFSIFLGITDVIVPIFNDEKLSAFEKLLKLINTIPFRLAQVSPLILNDLRIHFPKSYKEFISFREFMLFRIRDLFEKAQKEKLIRDDIDIDLLIDILLNTANSVVVPDYILAKNISFSSVIQQFSTILFFGILNPDAKNNLRGINK